MPDRRPLVAANWKMNKTVAETEAFLAHLGDAAERLDGVDLVVCPPYTALAPAVAVVRGTPLRIVAQNVNERDSGAFTGEISIPMLRELGVAGAIVGHSERRALYAETDEALALKVPALLDAGMLPILCVGETEAQREEERTEEVLRSQLLADLAEVAGPRQAEVVIAYEPVWAIGTGKTATPEQAQSACAFIRSLVAEEAAGAVRIVYGGSAKPDNAAELFAEPDIDGGLVGGASLEAGDFVKICEAAG